MDIYIYVYVLHVNIYAIYMYIYIYIYISCECLRKTYVYILITCTHMYFYLCVRTTGSTLVTLRNLEWGFIYQISLLCHSTSFFHDYQYTSYLLTMTFIFDRCRHSWAAMTNVKYGIDLKDLTDTFAKSIFPTSEKLTNALLWRHNGLGSVSNHQPRDCLLNRLFRRRSKKTPKLRVTGLCAGKSPGTGEFPAQMSSNAENVSIWWRHHGSFSTPNSSLVQTSASRQLSVFNGSYEYMRSVYRVTP